MSIAQTTGLTSKAVEQEIAELETSTRQRLKKLRALARVLADEEGGAPTEEEKTDDD